MNEVRHSHENHLKLLHEVKSRLLAKIEFTLRHPGRWTEVEFEEYKLCDSAWRTAVEALDDFEHLR